MLNVYLNIGSNINKHDNIRSGLRCLEEQFGEVLISPVYESAPVGFDGDAFFNLAAKISTTLSLKKLSDALKAIEDKHGRNREDKNFKGRTLDIDIVLYGELEGTIDDIELPRPELYFHDFVLKPMADLAGDMIDVKTGKSYLQLWDQSKAKIERNLSVIQLI